MLRRRSIHEWARIQTIARDVFDCPSFQPLQREAIDLACAEKSFILHLPTGGGKSLCYQLPAVLSTKTTIVISPLISLIQDQIERLKRIDVPPRITQLTGQLKPQEKQKVLEQLATDEPQIL